LEALSHKDAKIRAGAALALRGRAMSPKAADTVRPLLRDNVLLVRFQAAATLAQRDKKEAAAALPQLMEGLRHEDASVRLDAANVLHTLASTAAPARDALLAALQDENHFVRYVVADALLDLDVDKHTSWVVPVARQGLERIDQHYAEASSVFGLVRKLGKES